MTTINTTLKFRHRWESGGSMNIKIHIANPPQQLLEALTKCRLNYISARDIFHCLTVDADYLCGVFGDGDNGAYEWFTWNAGKLITSDVGFGDTLIALRDVLQTVTS
jgi:hypothetical protein